VARLWHKWRIAWVLRGGRVTSALIGASRPQQIIDCVGALDNLDFTEAELSEIDLRPRRRHQPVGGIIRT
jgi:aryl-alcohol dehydrogenase-like predicted oxidoreductase